MWCCFRVSARRRWPITFTRKHPSPPIALADTTAATVIIEQIADLTGVINLLREHLETLLVLPSQVAELSVQVGETRVLVESLATRQDATETHLADGRRAHPTPDTSACAGGAGDGESHGARDKTQRDAIHLCHHLRQVEDTLSGRQLQ